MARIFLIKLAVFGVIASFLGCGEKRQESVSSEADVSTNVVAGSQDVPEPVLSPEMKAAQEMRELLDDGNELAAIRAARNLMDSKDAAVRSEVVDAFAWMGKRALKELAEMANDEDDGIRETAMTGVEQALAETTGDNLKALAVEEVAVRLKRQDQQEVLLMALSDVDEKVALRLLARLAAEHQGTVLGEVARDYYSHYSGGEKFVSLSETEKFIKGDEVK